MTVSISKMYGLDHSLLYQARKFITAANVHYLKTWIFCYETAAPESPRRERYEKRLREFVAAKNLMFGVRLHAKLALDRGIALWAKGIALDEEIRRLL